MAVLSDSTILRRLQEVGDLVITPFYPDGLQPASYDMRLHWQVLVSPTRYEGGRVVDLKAEPESRYHVQPGRFVGVLSEESMSFPLNVAGRFGLRSEFTRHGLIAFGGIQIDPGFKGRLALSLFHAGPEPIALELGRRMFTIEFQSLDASATGPYRGEFQNQDDFPEVQREFILNAHTVSLSEIQSVPGELSSLALRLAQHESAHRIGERALSVTELAETQGVMPLDDLSGLSEFWPADEDVEDFRAAVRSWRGRQ